MTRRPDTAVRPGRRSFLAAGSALLMCSIAGVLTAQAEGAGGSIGTNRLWGALASGAGRAAGGAAEAARDQAELRSAWSAVTAGAPDAVGALRVEGTPVDEVVVRPRPGDDADFYLRHAADRAPSWAGCAYEDRRCDPHGPHRVVLAHHLGASDRLFSPLYDRWRAEKFAGLGPARWTGPDGAGGRMAAWELAPLCALVVDKGSPLVQRFSFSDVGDLRAWAAQVCGAASARAGDWQRIADRARAVLTLVTCASERSGQRERTAVLFARA